jgi:hypothetical protein
MKLATNNYFFITSIMMVCVVSGTFSISRLVNLASQENTITTVKQQVDSIRNSEPIVLVNTLVRSPNILNCEKLRHQVLFSTLKKHTAFNTRASCCSCEINSNIAKMPPQEQDYTIRLNLIQGAFEYFQNQLDQIFQARPSMPKIETYFCSFISWVSVTIFSHLLTRLTDKFFFSRL